METYWVPGVNNLGAFGRWAFAEFTGVCDVERGFGALIDRAAGAPPAATGAGA